MMESAIGARHLKFTVGFVLGIAAAQGLAPAGAEPPPSPAPIQSFRFRERIPMPAAAGPSTMVEQALHDLATGSPFRSLAPRTLLAAGVPRLAELLGPYARVHADAPQETRLLALSCLDALALEGSPAAREVLEGVAQDERAGSLRILAVKGLVRMGPEPSRTVLRRVLASAMVFGDGTLEDVVLVALGELPERDGFAS